jgi:hypothetical protein
MKLATVTGGRPGETDRLLKAVVAHLTEDGVRTVGAVRAADPVQSDILCDSTLFILPQGPEIRITQDLGAGSSACRMDAGALEDAVGLATVRLEMDGTDFAILNKFGLSEAEGRGFRAFISEAIARDIPVLLGLSETHRAAFEAFAGGMATRLQPDEIAILTWCRKVLDRSPVIEDAH